MKLLMMICSLWFALMAGFFFSYSATVMPGFETADQEIGMIAMQQINAAVANPMFAVGFWGALLLAAGGLATALYLRLNGTKLLFAGCVTYILGAFLITVVGNVPMNNVLGAFSVANPDGLAYWNRYLIDWTRLNHIRMAASFGAALIVLLPLVLPPSGDSNPSQNL